jgi:hypothetical protein
MFKVNITNSLIKNSYFYRDILDRLMITGSPFGISRSERIGLYFYLYT